MQKSWATCYSAISANVLPGFTTHSRSGSDRLAILDCYLFSLFPFVLNQVWSHRLHKQKIQHSEFVPSAPHLLLTASNDRTIRLWDLRQVKESNPTPLITYETPATANSGWCVHACVRACVCLCVHTCMHASVGVFVRACMRACVRACTITFMIHLGTHSKLLV